MIKNRALTSTLLLLALLPMRLTAETESRAKQEVLDEKSLHAVFDDMNAEEELEMLSKSETPCQPSRAYPCNPCRGQKWEGQDEDRVLVSGARALVLVDSPEYLLDSEALRNASGLVIAGCLDIPGSKRTLAKKLEPLFLDKTLTVKQIKKIKDAIHAYYSDHNQPFTLVLVPSQRISTSVLQLVVTPSKLGRVVMEGNEWADTCIVRNYFRLQPGDTLKTNTIQKDMSFANRNPYRHVNTIYAPGKEPLTTDVIIPVEARRPARVYVGADNTGIPTIRRQRLYAGFGIDRFMAFDNNLNFQYTTAYKPQVFQAFTGQWIIYLPWKNTLNIYGGYSVVNSELPFPTSSNKGTFANVSGRYTSPTVFKVRNPFEVTFGVDFKRTNSNVFFSELFPSTANTANILQFMASGRWTYEGNWARFELVGEYFYSPGKLISDQTDADYGGLRPGATAEYMYAKAAARYTHVLPLGFETILWLRGQLASKPLLSSEQYGLGGYDTVRGYDDYQLNMDNALNANFELRTPGIPMISYIRKYKIRDALQFLVFIDYGVGRNKESLPGLASPSWLLGVGPGARYTLDPNIALRIDWGWKVKKVPRTAPGGTAPIPYSGGDSMVDFSATLSY